MLGFQVDNFASEVALNLRPSQEVFRPVVVGELLRGLPRFQVVVDPTGPVGARRVDGATTAVNLVVEGESKP